MKIKHIRSKEYGHTPSELEHGEIAINYNDKSPKLFIKTDEDVVEEFSSDKEIKGYIDNNIDTLAESLENAIICQETNDVLDEVDTIKFLKYVEQYLTEEEKKQSRTNIGATDEEWVISQGFLTEHQDISNLSTKDEVSALQITVEGEIDSIQENVTNLTDGLNIVSAVMHSHENKLVIDGINDDDITRWNSTQPNIIESISVNNEPLFISDDKNVNIDLAYIEDQLSALTLNVENIELTPGPQGVGITSIDRTNGNGAAGTTDTYTITYSDNSKSTFKVYNGNDGQDGKPGDDGKNGITPEFISITANADSGTGVPYVSVISAKTNDDKYTLSFDFQNIKGEKGDTGDKGDKGDKGEDGTSVKILGSKNSYADLPLTNNANGDGYIIDENLYVWNGSDWENVGKVKGPQGEPGTNAYITGVTANVSPTTGTPSVKVTSAGTPSNISFNLSFDGLKGEPGDDGENGIGVKSFVKTSGNGEAGTTDTYTITFTNGVTSAITVYNGTNGKDGEDGANGNMWHVGTGVPLTTLGVAGDLYLEGIVGTVYQKRDGDYWLPTDCNLRGNDGKDGTNGAKWYNGTTSPDETIGANGDWYVNTSTWDVFYKESHIWVKKGCIKGETGSFENIDLNDYAKTEYVDEQISFVVSGASGAFDTLKEVEDWIENHKDQITILSGASHQHDNKEVLDTITGEKVETWDYTANDYLSKSSGGTVERLFINTLNENLVLTSPINSTIGIINADSGALIIQAKTNNGTSYVAISPLSIDGESCQFNKPPIKVTPNASGWVCTNLNADLLDGKHASDFVLQKDLVYYAKVQSDWNETSTSSEAYIKNKPNIPTSATVKNWGFTRYNGVMINNIVCINEDLSGVLNLGSGYTKDENLSKIAFSGDYNDLTNKPTIPSVDGFIKNISLATSTETLYIVGSTSKSGTTTSLNTSSTDVYISGGEVYAASDERLKDFGDNVEVDFNELSKIPKVYYSWKDDEEKRQMIGTSAQKLKEIYPELVSENEDGKMAVSYEKLSIIALAAVDKLHKENEELKDRLKRIEEKLGL